MGLNFAVQAHGRYSKNVPQRMTGQLAARYPGYRDPGRNEETPLNVELIALIDEAD